MPEQWQHTTTQQNFLSATSPLLLEPQDTVPQRREPICSGRRRDKVRKQAALKYCTQVVLKFEDGKVEITKAAVKR